MENIIIIAILGAIFAMAIKETIKHFKGQGGCCGGGSTAKPRKKKLTGRIVGTYVVTIEGMHCENCKNRIEGKLNDLDGVACRVNLSKKTATVTFTRNISRDEIRRVIETNGYTVVDIQ